MKIDDIPRGEYEYRFGCFNPTTITILILAIILLMFGLQFLWQQIKLESEEHSSSRSHNLAIAACAYSMDHSNTYPYAHTSTEVFQILYDGHYLTQAQDVFLTTNGGKKIGEDPYLHSPSLTSKNVSWDFVTHASSGLNNSDPSDIPLLFSCVTSVPDWHPGVNSVEISWSDPWGTDGVTVGNLSQQCRFIRPKEQWLRWDRTVDITYADFSPEANDYVTRQP